MTKAVDDERAVLFAGGGEMGARMRAFDVGEHFARAGVELAAESEDLRARGADFAPADVRVVGR